MQVMARGDNFLEKIFFSFNEQTTITRKIINSYRNANLFLAFRPFTLIMVFNNNFIPGLSCIWKESEKVKSQVLYRLQPDLGVQQRLHVQPVYGFVRFECKRIGRHSCWNLWQIKCKIYQYSNTCAICKVQIHLGHPKNISKPLKVFND